MPDPELGSPMFDEPELGEDERPEFDFYINLFTSAGGNAFLPLFADRELMLHLLDTVHLFQQDSWRKADLIFSTDKHWFADYPGQMRAAAVDGLGERLKNGDLSFPCSEFSVEVTDELRMRAQALLAFHHSSTAETI